MTGSKTVKGNASVTINNGYLRISLPRNLYDGQQKFINLGLKDNETNRAKAQLKLVEIQKDIDYKCFDLSLAKYCDNPSSPLVKKELTIKELIEGFEEKYFFSRKRNRQSINTCRIYKYFLNRFLKEYFDLPLCEEVITQAIGKTEAATVSRTELVKTLRVLCRLYKFSYDFTGLSKGYKPKPRNLPSDEQIVSAYTLIQQMSSKSTSLWNDKSLERSSSWGWCLMIVATYGLRPYELFAIDYDKSFKKEDEYSIFLNEDLTDGLKTGNRRTYPILKEWVDKFDLTNIKNKVLTDYEGKRIEQFNSGFGARIKTRKEFVESDVLKQCLDFKLYDLRHRYAIRAHELGYPAEAVARWMGHTLAIHIKIYQQWLKEDTDKLVFKNNTLQAEEFKEKAEIQLSFDELEAEINLLKEENNLLREENNQLKQMLNIA